MKRWIRWQLTTLRDKSFIPGIVVRFIDWLRYEAFYDNSVDGMGTVFTRPIFKYKKIKIDSEVRLAQIIRMNGNTVTIRYLDGKEEIYE